MNKALWLIFLTGFLLSIRQIRLLFQISSGATDTISNEVALQPTINNGATALYHAFVKRGDESPEQKAISAYMPVTSGLQTVGQETEKVSSSISQQEEPMPSRANILSEALTDRIKKTTALLHEKHRHHKKPNISYTFVPKKSIDYAEEWDKCLSGSYKTKRGRHRQVRLELWDDVKAVTNFSTTLQLDKLRILVLGDSVGMQLFTILDRASGGNGIPLTDRHVVSYAFGDHISYGTSKNGRIGAWRTTALILESSEGKPPPNMKGGGWSLSTAQDLLNVTIDHTSDYTETVGAFDTIFFRIPHGWMSLNQIIIPHVIESLHIASQVFGARTAILLTLPFVNNVVPDKRLAWFKKNEELRQFATNFIPNETIPGIHRLVLLDFAELTNRFIQVNAKLLGYLNNTDDSEMQYLDQVRLAEFVLLVYPSAAHVCAGPTFKKQKRILCFKNALSYDGMHICPNTYGGRIVAATGCLMQCLYQDYSIDTGFGGIFDTSPSSQQKSVDCQRECNEKYMTLRPVETSF